MKTQMMQSETGLEGLCQVIAFGLISFSFPGETKRIINSADTGRTGGMYEYRFHIFAMLKESTKSHFGNLTFLIIPLKKKWG